MRYDDYDYSRVFELLKILFLESARVRSGVLFLFQTINYYIDFLDLLQEINLYVPSRNLMVQGKLFL